MPNAVLTKGTINSTTVNSSESLTTYEIEVAGLHIVPIAVEVELPGASKQFRTYTVENPGLSNIVVTPMQIELPGTCRQLKEFSLQLPGKHGVAIINVAIELPGASARYREYTTQHLGVAHARETFTIETSGAARVQELFTIDVPGVAQYGLGHEIEAIGRYGVNQPTHVRVYRQAYRVANTDLETLELYAGYDAMPDFDDVAQPVATGDPINWTPTYPGAGLTTILHLVVRKRNRYNLLSFNQHPRLIEIDENGDEVLGPLTPPELVKVLDGSSAGALQAWVRYAYEGDQNPADVWELYAEIDADPVVGVDTPVATEAMGASGNSLVPWRATVEALTTGETYHIMAVVKRTADGAYEQSDVLQHTIAVVYDVDEGDLSVFVGDEYELKE